MKKSIAVFLLLLLPALACADKFKIQKETYGNLERIFLLDTDTGQTWIYMNDVIDRDLYIGWYPIQMNSEKIRTMWLKGKKVDKQ